MESVDPRGGLNEVLFGRLGKRVENGTMRKYPLLFDRHVCAFSRWFEVFLHS